MASQQFIYPHLFIFKHLFFLQCQSLHDQKVRNLIERKRSTFCNIVVTVDCPHLKNINEALVQHSHAICSGCCINNGIISVTFDSKPLGKSHAMLGTVKLRYRDSPSHRCIYQFFVYGIDDFPKGAADRSQLSEHLNSKYTPEFMI